MQRLENYFRGLAEMSRLRIVNLLLERELCVCDIQRILKLTQPSASRHLNYLKNAGLVADRRDGLRVFYRLLEGESPVLQNLCDFLRGALRGEEPFESDVKQLRDALASGACAIPPGDKGRKCATEGLA
jgi:ArsR family transcriptional regulator, arsenate/arsenite/antimonite-responsive transcriptional repressor